MSFTIIHDGTDRQTWLARRQGGVSATDVARLARGGANTWAAVHAEKAGKGRDFTNAAMQHGTDREPMILRFAEKQFQVLPFGKLIAADDEPRFICTPDALGKGRIGEVKTTVHDWEVISEVPGRYIDQVLWQMRVTGYRRADLIFEPHENGIPLHPFPKSFPIDWDATRVAHLESIAYEFLAEDGEPDEDAAILDALLTDAAMRKEIADAAAESYRRATAAIEVHLQGKPRRFDGSLASLTRSPDGITASVDTTRLKRELPDIAAQYTRQSPRKGSLRINVHTDDEKGQAA
ncbi:YqaJ viral recombinase family protein [Microbacterium sp. p3-SID338]|uniref:YqaJ viral recombinase family protein n=1 Tax=Microbacterium sp. p3-SID338 TaxID=2916214 RepID=UPI0021A8014E|nr:YqaJ viral recombinase family protein [Microbacterium sp. p3-SID338]MCT1395637.1 YqaJ viral recombinase family protein [Microbacterium sp. p3-SID338]